MLIFATEWLDECKATALKKFNLEIRHKYLYSDLVKRELSVEGNLC